MTTTRTFKTQAAAHRWLNQEQRANGPVSFNMTPTAKGWRVHACR